MTHQVHDHRCAILISKHVQCFNHLSCDISHRRVWSKCALDYPMQPSGLASTILARERTSPARSLFLGGLRLSPFVSDDILDIDVLDSCRASGFTKTNRRHTRLVSQSRTIFTSTILAITSLRKYVGSFNDSIL
jgi:hypothetical protein